MKALSIGAVCVMRVLTLSGCHALWVLAGCAGTQAEPERMALEMTIEAKGALNPDGKGRAAPVMVRIYELGTEALFVSADYFLLEKSDKAALGQDLLARDEFILRPGEKRVMTRKLHAESRALGILVGYRDLGKARWREVYRLPPAPERAWYRAVLPARKINLHVLLDQQDITVSNPD